jgi:phosphoglycolate phosphatase
MNMQNHLISTAVFDFDGTLIDSAPGILAGFAAALQAAELTPCVPLSESLIGPPLAETLMRLSGSEDAKLISFLTEQFKLYYDTTGVVTTPAYPHVQAMLEGLMDTGVELHIATNKRLAVTHAILDHLGWRDYFASVYALDMVTPRLANKPALLAKQIAEQDLNKTNTIYIGDKYEDGEAATANQLGFYYAAWGYGGLQRTQMETDWNWLDCPSAFPSVMVSQR